MLPAEIGLIAVAVVFLLLQLAWVPRPFGVSTDEATYLAKVVPAAPELYWTAPRAWGMPILAAPVALFASGLPEIRLYFAVLVALLLVAAFRPWLRVLHPAVAVLAALVFSTTWFTLVFGSLVMPNLYVALGSVGATGLYLRTAAHPTWWRFVLIGLAACLVALVRPTDSVLTLGPLFALGLVVPRLRRPGALAALAVGVLAGWSPWLVEAFLRFGDPVSRLTAAETVGPGGVRLELSNLLIFPRLLDGAPTYCCRTGPVTDAGPMPWLLTGWLLVLVGLALIGVAAAAWLRRLPEVAAAAVPAALVAGFYLLMPSFTTLRFLLPAFALASLPVAVALVSVLTAARGPGRVVAASLVGLALLGHLGLMLPQAHAMLQTQGEARARPIRTAEALRPRIQGRPCLVVGVEEQATAYYLGCRVQVAHPTTRPPARVREAQRAGGQLVAVLRSRPAKDSYLASWPEIQVAGLPSRWRAYAPPG